MVKPPTVRSLPDILSVAGIARLLKATRYLRFRVFVVSDQATADFSSGKAS
jgi:hypothetical protein